MSPAVESSSTWSSNLKLNLAMLSYSSGINIPYIGSPWLLRTRIGILLLIPMQLFAMFIITIPCVFMEIALGQYSNRAVLKVWELCPILRGIGVCSFATFIFYQIYYSFLCTSTLSFAYLSVTSDQEWKSCNKSWNNIHCFTLRDNYTRRLECNQKYTKEKCDKMQWQSSIEQFYFHRVLDVGDDSNYMGAPQKEILVCVLVTMSIIFLANYEGPKSTEKFLIAFAIIPTIQLLILFFTPLTDENGYVTLHYLFTHFDKSPLGDYKTWATVINLSLSGPGLGFGVYITLGTHCSFRNPLHLRAVVISLVNVLLTILYSITIQNFLVSLCLQSKMLIDDFLNLEQELSVPEAVFFLEHSSRFWMTMWLSNSYMLGVRTLIVMMSLNAEIVYNVVPAARKRHNTCIIAFCVLIYGGCIFFSTGIGFVIAKTMNKFINEFSVLFINTFQLIGVVYFYGIRKFRDDIHFMLGIRSSVYWNALYVLNPILLLSTLVYGIYNFYSERVTIYFVEHALLWFTPMVIFSYGFLHLVTCLSKEEIPICKPSTEWVPRHKELITSRKMFTAYNIAKEYLYRRRRFRHQPEFEEETEL